MKNSYYFSFLLFLLVSCAGGVRTQKVDYSGFFTDNNSKVWLITTYQQENEEFVENDVLSSDLIIFYSSGKYVETTLPDLASRNYSKGFYELDSENNTVVFIDADSKRKFGFEIQKDGAIIFSPLDGTNYAFRAVPFPELN